MSSLTVNQEVPVWLRELCERLQSDDQALLTVVNLNLRRVNRQWMTVLCDGLRGKKASLQSLNLTSSLINRLDISSSQVLQTFIQSVLDCSASSPRILHVSYNSLTGPLDGMGKALSTNTTLTELHLDHNRLDCAAAGELAKGLQANRALEVLQLASNLIGDQGASKLAHALVHNRSLRTLALSRNQIGSAGGQALIDALWIHKNTSLTTLDLEQNEDVPADMLGTLTVSSQANAVGRGVLLDPAHVSSPGLIVPVLGRGAKKSPSVFFLLLQESHSVILERASSTASATGRSYRDRPLKKARCC